MNRYLIGVVSGAIAFAAFAEDCLDLLVPEPQRIVRHGGVVASVEEPEVVCASIPDAPKAVSDQAYILEISDDCCRITAGGDAGVRYAKATLDQLLALSGGRLPACTITDWPALKWRGFMIDCGRNYLELEGVRAILDMMAAYKMNIFNWSLCNDWGWRLESKKYPQLNDPSVYTRNIGKFYTQDEFREIVCYAAARGITVMPEIDMPGHSTAFRKGMGVEAIATPGIDEVVSGIYEELCSLADAKTMPFIHIGTDEVYASNVKVPFDWPSKWAKTVNAQERTAVVWAPGLELESDCCAIDMLWGKHRPEFLAKSPHPFFDSTRLYIEAWTPFDVTPRAAFIKPCWQEVAESRKLGAIVCAWQDATAGESGLAQLGECVVFPAIVALGDNFWHGRKEDDLKSASLMPQPGTEKFDEAVRLERRLVAQRDVVLKDFAHPFPFFAQTQMRWRVRDCETGEILAKDIASGAIWLKTDVSMQWRKHSAVAAKSKGRVAVETWVKSPEDMTCGAWIDLAGIDMNYGRLRMPCFPKKGQWNRFNATIEINGEKLPPPDWQNPGTVEEPVVGRYYSPLMEQVLVDEMPILRDPYPVKLNKGWNRICIESAVAAGKPDISLVSFALFKGPATHPMEVPGLEWCSEPPAESFAAYSMLTHDGRRLVSHVEGTNTVYELVPTNALPVGLPPVREWNIYAVKSTHTDIGLHNSQYVQRHGSVIKMDEARRLVEEDPCDDNPAAFRYVSEGAWYFNNYPADRGERAALALVTNEMARGRIDTGVTCAGNHTHLYGFEELCRSIYTKKGLEDKWGVKTRTMLMTDNPGISWSVVAPYADAGLEHILFSPNQWNPHPSTIWKPDASIPFSQHNPECGGGGNRIDVRYGSTLPMVFWWESPDAAKRLLVWCGGMYNAGGERFGFRTSCQPGRKRDVPTVEEVEPKMATQLKLLEGRYPYDVWLVSDYDDDEEPSMRQADLFKAWNAKWKWPQLKTVGRLDEPFDRLKAKWSGKIATLRGEITSGWLQHAACTPDLLARKFAADRALPLAETLASLAALTNGAAYPAEEFRRAWDALVWNDEHSYGTSGYQGRRVFETWMQHRDWIEKAEKTAKRMWNFGNVELWKYENVKLSKGDNLENKWYKVRVNAKGEIESIFDKELGRELLNGIANKFLYTRDNHRTWEPDAADALGAEVTQKVWLDPDEKKILIENTFKHARDLFNLTRYDRFGYLAFPFDVPDFRFAAQLNGPVIDPVRDQSGFATDAYVAVRNWCAVENGDFGVALISADSCLTEFGEIHPDKTCYGDKIKSSGIYPYLFTDWLQMHNPDGDSFNMRFRYAITSYAGNWQDAHIPRFAARAVATMDGLSTPTDALAELLEIDCPNVELLTLKAADDGNGFIARFRETEGKRCRTTVRQSLSQPAKYELCTLTERDTSPLDDFAFDLPPFGYATVRIVSNALHNTDNPENPAKETAPIYAYTGLITEPRASHGEKDGQLYLLWGVNATPDWNYDELYRSETPDFPCDASTFRAIVTNEAPQGLAYRMMRYEDLGLKSHSRYWYRIVPVFKDGRKGAPSAVFSGLTREVEGSSLKEIACAGSNGVFRVRCDGAQVTSWRPAALGCREVFFMPQNAPWGKEVHGGLPICWPWFGKREGLTKHGLARYLKWRLVRRIGNDGVELEAVSNARTMKAWPHAFRLRVAITADGPDSLKMVFSEKNAGSKPYESAFGVHPYFSVCDARNASLDGKPLPAPFVMESFAADGKPHVLADEEIGVSYCVEASDNDSWFVWNPGVERTPLCETLRDGEWKRFFCLEPFSDKSEPLAPDGWRTHAVRVRVRDNSARQTSPGAEVRDVTDASAYNAWPMIQNVGGRLICAYSHGSKHTITEGSRGVFARVSTDGGAIWSDEICVVNDPAVGEVPTGKGLDSDGAMLLWVRRWGAERGHDLYRTVDGMTFEKVASPALSPMPMQITDVLSVPGAGLMSLWFAGDYGKGEGHSWGVLTSSDNGRTWNQRTVEANLPKKDWPTEPCAVFLGCGRILALARCERGGECQFQIVSEDSGRTWRRTRTNIADVLESTPSLIYDETTGLVFNYYYQRGTRKLKRRAALVDDVFSNPCTWPFPESLFTGAETRDYDAGNVNVTTLDELHVLAFYTGSPRNTAVKALCVSSKPLPCSAAAHKVAFGGRDGEEFLVDGKSVQIRAGELEPQRIPREYWRHRVRMCKAMGLNAISSYFMWNDFEQADGSFDFKTGNRDVAAFLSICHEEGMMVLFRPGPYVCGEWDFGGLPSRLLAEDVAVRSSDPRFLSEAEKYLAAIADIAQPFLARNGGPIVLTQIENEYGSWPFKKDAAYLRWLKDFWKSRGFGPFYMADGAGDRFLKNLIYPDKEIAVGFDPAMDEKHWNVARKFNLGVPILSAETYPGWLRHWGEGWWEPTDITQAVKWFMDGRRSFCFFVAHGGTSFGFTAGANDGGEGGFKPDLTSYDYGAPIDEQGRPTKAYFDYREIIFNALGEEPLPVPDPMPSMAFAQVLPRRHANLATFMGGWVEFEDPPCLEQLGQNQGIASYRAVLPPGKEAELAFGRIADYAQAWLDGVRIATIDRRLKQELVVIPARDKPAQLEIVVEAMGHINFGRGMKDDRKGVMGPVWLGDVEIKKWRVCTSPLSAKEVSAIGAESYDGKSGGHFRAIVSLEKVADTFIDMSKWAKGTLFVNGRNLGRYWNVGPQFSLYCPASFLHVGDNVVDIVEMEQTDPAPIRGLAAPLADGSGVRTHNAANEWDE